MLGEKGRSQDKGGSQGDRPTTSRLRRSSRVESVTEERSTCVALRSQFVRSGTRGLQSLTVLLLAIREVSEVFERLLHANFDQWAIRDRGLRGTETLRCTP